MSQIDGTLAGYRGTSGSKILSQQSQNATLSYVNYIFDLADVGQTNAINLVNLNLSSSNFIIANVLFQKIVAPNMFVGVPAIPRSLANGLIEGNVIAAAPGVVSFDLLTPELLSYFGTFLPSTGCAIGADGLCVPYSVNYITPGQLHVELTATVAQNYTLALLALRGSELLI